MSDIHASAIYRLVKAGRAPPAWGCYLTELPGADGTAVGTGAQNTADILSGCSELPIAASVAAAYLGPTGDTAGWFLPSKDELDAMYQQRALIGGFANETYFWTSSEIDLVNAWSQRFDGFQYPYGKIAPQLVRPVRAF